VLARVMALEGGHRGVYCRRIEGRIECAGERAPHEHARPLADVGAHGRLADRRAAELDEHRIDGGGQVGDRVEQRSVEIEQDRARAETTRAHAEASAARKASTMPR